MYLNKIFLCVTGRSTSLFKMDLLLTAYSDQKITFPKTVLFCLFIKRSETTVFKTLLSTEVNIPNVECKRNFAKNIHGYADLSVNDVIKVFERSGVLSESLKAELNNAFNKCTSCREKKRSSISCRTFFQPTIVSVQWSCSSTPFFVTKLSPGFILHNVDVVTAFSVSAALLNRQMSAVTRSFKETRIDALVAPTKVSEDSEF